MTFKEATKQSYNQTALAFAHNVKDLAPTSSIRRFVALLPRNPKILDVGSGSGRDAKLFCDLGCDVVGIDFSKELLTIATSHVPKAQFKLMDIEELDFAPASFDGVWAGCSLCHIAKNTFSSVLKAIEAVLKPNGLFYLTVKKGEGESFEKDLRYGQNEKFWSFFSENELLSFLKESPFKILDLKVVKKKTIYQTHDALRAFCLKDSHD